jgi:pilus assembly protein CpaE
LGSCSHQYRMVMRPIAAAVVIANRELEESLITCLQKLPVRLVFEISEVPDDWPDFLDRIERTEPDVVLLDVTKLKQPLEEVIRRIRSTKVHPVVIALHTTEDSEAILSAFRSGASEYLSPPFEQPLRLALERLAKAKEKSTEGFARRGKTIAFVSAKGGCGATTIACHCAVELAQRTEKKVLVVDLDLESGLIGFLLKSKSPYSVADAARNLLRLDQSYWHGIVAEVVTGLDVMAAPPQGSAGLIPPEQLAQVVDYARGSYDWIVIDLGRNLTAHAQPMLNQIEELYIVITHEIPALHQAKEMVARILRTGYAPERVRLVINRMPKHSDVTLEELAQMLGLPIWATIVNDYLELQEAYAEGRLVDSSTALGKSYAHLVSRIAGLEEKKKRLSLFG